jgi:tRNA threonylcarbamoyladenosine biosynthesis protein TsaE
MPDSPVWPLSYQTTSFSLDETQAIGQKIGKIVVVGTLITLYGSLGSGKTSFVQGLARGLGVPPDYYITSPTYTLINDYPGRYRLYHVDLYRIDGIDEAEDIGLYEIMEGDGITAIEWADRIEKDLPSDRVRLEFETNSDDSRAITLQAQGINEIKLLNEIIMWIEGKK